MQHLEKISESMRSPVTVDLDRDLYERLASLAKSRDLTIKYFINSYLLMNIEKDEMLKDYAPFLSLDNVGSSVIYIQDSRSNYNDEPVMVAVRRVKGDTTGKRLELKCITDQSGDCVHVKYCFGLPELGKVNIQRLASFINTTSRERRRKRRQEEMKERLEVYKQETIKRKEHQKNDQLVPE